MKKPILQANNIHKSYFSPSKIDVLKEISFELMQKQSIAIMGASGEGKTTLLHILGSLETFDTGSLTIHGKSEISAQTINKHIGFIFQSYNLLQDFTLYENILMPAYIGRNKISHKRAEDLLKQVGLEDRKNFLAKNLSGGEKQRAAIARALCNNPDIILADEPSGNLDHDNSKAIHKLLISCVKKLNKSLIVATHDKELATLCDKIFILKNGMLSSS